MSIPKTIIPIADANDLFENYDRSLGTNKTTQFVTLEYQELKDYLAFIDKEAASTGIAVTGLRIYFGQNPKAKFPSGRTPAKPDANTVFMNPTTNFPGVNGEISFALQADKGGNKVVAVGDIINNPSMPNIQSLAANKGHFPPPPHAGDVHDYH